MAQFNYFLSLFLTTFIGMSLHASSKSSEVIIVNNTAIAMHWNLKKPEKIDKGVVQPKGIAFISLKELHGNLMVRFGDMKKECSVKTGLKNRLFSVQTHGELANPFSENWTICTATIDGKLLDVITKPLDEFIRSSIVTSTSPFLPPVLGDIVAEYTPDALLLPPEVNDIVLIATHRPQDIARYKFNSELIRIAGLLNAKNQRCVIYEHKKTKEKKVAHL